MSDLLKQQHLYESLSALVDNEASELELHRILAESEKDPSVRERWHRYQLARTALKGEVTAVSFDISDSVRKAVSQLDFLEEPTKAASNADLSLARTSGQTVAIESKSWRANIVRFAIAASVASVVLITSQQFNVFGGGTTTPLMTAEQSSVPTSPFSDALIDTTPQNSPFAVVDLQNVAGTFNTPQQNRLPQQTITYSPTRQQKQLQDERVRMYIQQLMMEHAENSAQQSGAGLIPYTRAPVDVQQ